MQPYFFPYLGYFGLIKNTDKWIVFDTPQFIYHGWIERNRIIKPKEGWQYIQVPLKKHSRNCSIKEIEIRNNEKWIDLIFAKLTVYKNIAPYYAMILDLLNNIFKTNTESIVKLNCIIIESVCDYLNLKWDYSVFSEMNMKVEDVNEPDEWALNICKSVGGVTEYWNPVGGLQFFNKSKYINNNIDIKFYNQNLIPYNQKRKIFETGLSIIDVMMFNSPPEIQKMLNQFEIL